MTPFDESVTNELARPSMLRCMLESLGLIACIIGLFTFLLLMWVRFSGGVIYATTNAAIVREVEPHWDAAKTKALADDENKTWFSLRIGEPQP